MDMKEAMKEKQNLRKKRIEYIYTQRRKINNGYYRNFNISCCNTIFCK